MEGGVIAERACSLLKKRVSFENMQIAIVYLYIIEMLKKIVPFSKDVNLNWSHSSFSLPFSLSVSLSLSHGRQ